MLYLFPLLFGAENCSMRLSNLSIRIPHCTAKLCSCIIIPFEDWWYVCKLFVTNRQFTLCLNFLFQISLLTCLFLNCEVQVWM